MHLFGALSLLMSLHPHIHCNGGSDVLGLWALKNDKKQGRQGRAKAEVSREEVAPGLVSSGRRLCCKSHCGILIWLAMRTQSSLYFRKITGTFVGI